MSVKTIKKKLPKNCQYYNPKNKEKYVGQMPIICRSSWELAFSRWCDYNEAVLEWASESIEVPYRDPTIKNKDGTFKKRRYYPDFYMKIIDKNDNISKYVVEIKPEHETKPPIQGKGTSRGTLLKQKRAWTINEAKWKAADAFCKKTGMQFKVLTEKDIMR